MNFINKNILNLEKKKVELLSSIAQSLRSRMPEELYRHVESTCEYSTLLGEKYLEKHLDEKELAAEDPFFKKKDSYYYLCAASLLHDYGKIFRFEELVTIIRENNIEATDFEINSRAIVHSKAGVFLACRDFGIKQKVILKAMEAHTIGSLKMNIFDKILYISDKLEYTRAYEDVEKLRSLSLQDLDLCLREVYKSNIIYVVSRNKLLHPDTSKIWNTICGGY